MNSLDASLAYLIRQDARQVSLGFVDPKASGSSSSSADSRRALARDITQSVADMTTGITTAIIQARQAGRTPVVAPPIDLPETIGGEEFGVQAATPWGKIALGGTAVVIITGLIAYIAATSKKK